MVGEESSVDDIKKNIDDYHSQFEYFVPKPVVDRCKFRNDSNLIGALYNFLIKHSPFITPLLL